MLLNKMVEIILFFMAGYIYTKDKIFFQIALPLRRKWLST